MKAVLRGKFIAVSTYMKKQKIFQINNLTFHIKKMEKEQNKSKAIRGKEKIKMRVKIHDSENTEI